MTQAGSSTTPPYACALVYKFTGKERDAESGLDYFGARYYASNMGRWMSPDWADKPEAVPYSSLDNPQSLNLYGYVGNNPLSRADPDGHCPWCEVLEEAAESPAGQAAERATGQVFSAVAGAAIAFGAKASGVLDKVADGIAANPGSIQSGSWDVGQSYNHPEQRAENLGSGNAPANTASPSGPTGGLPKPPSGKGSVPPDQRDPKRVSTAAEKDQQLAKQGGKCANCGEPVKPGEGIGHHVERHADGGKTDSTNVPVVCKDCHKDLHSPN